MEINYSVGAELLTTKRCQENVEMTLEETKLLKLPNQKIERREAAIIYYLSRNGKLDHPHCIKVQLSSSGGIYLKDFTNALSMMRGPGMAKMYSWSSKRSYKTGYVWQDLSGHEFIHPCLDNDYVLKGSLLTEGSLSCRTLETSISNMAISMEMSGSAQGSNSSTRRRRTNSWSTIDNLEEPTVVYNAKSGGSLANERTDASTQTCTKESEEKKLNVCPIDVSIEDHLTCKRSDDCSNGRVKLSSMLMEMMGCGLKLWVKKKKDHYPCKEAAKEASFTESLVSKATS